MVDYSGGCLVVQSKFTAFTGFMKAKEHSKGLTAT